MLQTQQDPTLWSLENYPHCRVLEVTIKLLIKTKKKERKRNHLGEKKNKTIAITPGSKPGHSSPKAGTQYSHDQQSPMSLCVRHQGLIIMLREGRQGGQQKRDGISEV